MGLLEHRPNLRALAEFRPDSIFSEESSWRTGSKMALDTYRSALVDIGVTATELTTKVHFVHAWAGEHYFYLIRSAHAAGMSPMTDRPSNDVLLKMVKAWKAAGH